MNNDTRPLVLVIAGLDSGGGAGASADCLTIHDLGAYALPTLSCITAQSLKAVTCLEPVGVNIFKQQLSLAAQDWDNEPAACKVGLIATQQIMDECLEFFRQHPKMHVVWDPVLNATAGKLESADLKSALPQILSVTTLFTPNLPEALELADWTTTELEQQGLEKLAQFFLDQGCKAVLIKGGHRPEAENAIDFFATKDFCFSLVNPRVKGDGAHGGGCALSSAVAALLAQDFALHDAVALAKAYVYQGIVNPAISADHCRPPLGHLGMPQEIGYLPKILEPGFPQQAGPFALGPENLGLYPVVDNVPLLEKLLHLGVKTIQLRIKNKADLQLLEKIELAVALCEKHQARLYIDDHYELAIQAHAYGVHLGMEDLKEADLDAIQRSGLHLGVSTHGVYELCKALSLRPSYIALGHIFPTTTKQMPSQPQGIRKLAIQAQLLKRAGLAMVAIGGIKLHSLQDVLQTGVGSVAVVTALSQAQDLEETVATWLEYCTDGGAEA